MAAPFPGNVRELENEIQRAVALVDEGQPITADILSENIRGGQSSVVSILKKSGSLRELTESIEKYMIVEALKKNNGNITHTAQSLGLSRVGLQKKIHRYGLAIPKTD